MNRSSTLAAFACAFALISTGAMAQMRDPTIPAGAAILSGTPSGGLTAGGLSARSVPPVTTTSPITGRSSSCGAGPGCGGPIIVEPRVRGRR
ncbi:hypothetical protein [Methyloferula stellata]|uniref:hypothetical protein n=1 Tax=Methyloferula stellata TaxID=876270 RepID=UPI001269858F|nr:hypothetical protein [Methyloferula stellata]